MHRQLPWLQQGKSKGYKLRWRKLCRQDLWHALASASCSRQHVLHQGCCRRYVVFGAIWMLEVFGCPGRSSSSSAVVNKQAMLCYVVFCCIVIFYATLCCILCSFVLNYAILFCFLLCCAMLWVDSLVYAKVGALLTHCYKKAHSKN